MQRQKFITTNTVDRGISCISIACVISLDPTNSTAPFEQIKIQIIRQRATGDLKPGDKLPTVRRLAQDLKLAPNTVAKAYRELETDGYIETRGRSGSFVTGDAEAVTKQVHAAARQFLHSTRNLGVSDSVAVRAMLTLANVDVEVNPSG